MILNFRTSLKFAVTALLLFLTGALQTATAQSPAMLKAHHAQGGTQTQSAANSRALEEAGLSAVDVQDLIGTLEDPDARDRLLNQLKTPKAGADAAALPSNINRAGLAATSWNPHRINRISEELVGGATMVLNAPRLVDWRNDRCRFRKPEAQSRFFGK